MWIYELSVLLSAFPSSWPTDESKLLRHRLSLMPHSFNNSICCWECFFCACACTLFCLCVSCVNISSKVSCLFHLVLHAASIDSACNLQLTVPALWPLCMPRLTCSETHSWAYTLMYVKSASSCLWNWAGEREHSCFVLLFDQQSLKDYSYWCLSQCASVHVSGWRSGIYK